MTHFGKKERQASVISSQKQGDNLKQIINILADQKTGAAAHD